MKDIHKNMIKMRRELHRIPEVGFNEVKTSQYIKNKLIDFGFHIEQTAKTGIIGYKEGSSSKGAIAFRADMDGLRIKEETGLSFASEEEGMMHACGHDGHMAILLGLAMYLSRIPKLNRDIVLIFQPAEEGPGGAEVIVKEGILKKYNVEAIFGLHIYPGLGEGRIGARPGAMMAQTGEFDIIIKGKSGHGAMPHASIDAIYVSSQLVINYQSIISRNIEPIQGAVLTIGKIKGGSTRNIIAEEVKIEGTIRAFDIQVYNHIKRRMNEINKGLEKMYNVNVSIQFHDMYPAVVNDKGLFEEFKRALNDDITIIKPMMLAEDFSYYQREIPGIFFMLGSRNEELKLTYPLHSCHFNFNEEILRRGLISYIKLCKNFGILNK
ncbi:M20 metallopeptidase family protein [Caldisalinibacter kiritimatiensis]|uniref:M20 metallopeptidase family protein n=1 Tax=Caldisalinibacter kiritimatiensis TaxID=1304284 RepID=UPI0012DD1742|nr:M20 family metallopeptidase [Caldisalinibacter kiritimatiensis]